MPSVIEILAASRDRASGAGSTGGGSPTPAPGPIVVPGVQPGPGGPAVAPPGGRVPVGTPGFPTSPYNPYSPGRPRRPPTTRGGAIGLTTPSRGPRAPRGPKYPKRPKPLTPEERERIAKDPRVQLDNCVRPCSAWRAVSSYDFLCKTEACVLPNNDWLFRVAGGTFLLKKGQPIDDAVRWANKQCDRLRSRPGQPGTGPLTGPYAPLRPPSQRWDCPTAVCRPAPPPIVAAPEPIQVQLPPALPMPPGAVPMEGTPAGTRCVPVAFPSRFPVSACFEPDGSAYWQCGGLRFDPTGRTSDEIAAACGGYAVGVSV